MLSLVVDDARVARALVSRMMTELGFDVIEAGDGQEAMAKLESNLIPDAIVTDWNMPVMDGVELARTIRSTAPFTNVPILMISSEADPRRVAKALLAGVDEYLFKPVDTQMIKDRLEIMGVYVGVRS